MHQNIVYFEAKAISFLYVEVKILFFFLLILELIFFQSVRAFW